MKACKLTWSVKIAWPAPAACAMPYIDVDMEVVNQVLQQLFEVLVPILILVTCLHPLGHRFTVENKNMEEGVEEEDGSGFDGDAVEQDRLGSTSNVYDIRVG
ncbi:hypothetical protein F4604DRAFT_1676790 [Suillus subluteus]|nr:hypothetical protein F4604DRAFT_1676790 [Suillus subluteus]